MTGRYDLAHVTAAEAAPSQRLGYCSVQAAPHIIIMGCLELGTMDTIRMEIAFLVLIGN